MSTIQNLKNFIRHGKQARTTQSPHAEPVTNVSNVHAQPQKYQNYAPQQHGFGNTEPNIHQKQQAIPQGAAGGFSVAGHANQNAVAQANETAARAAAEKQKLQDADYDRDVVQRIVAEERESKGKMPRYPGLERWELVEKMGDGAFSNVYRARDTQGQWGEVAIKVVRKFEMNSNQVSHILALYVAFLAALVLRICTSFIRSGQGLGGNYDHISVSIF